METFHHDGSLLPFGGTLRRGSSSLESVLLLHGRKWRALSPSVSPVSRYLVRLVKIAHSDDSGIKCSEWGNGKTLVPRVLEKHYCKWASWVHRELTADTAVVPFPSSGEWQLLPTRCLPWKHLQKQLMKSLESQPSPQSSFNDSFFVMAPGQD